MFESRDSKRGITNGIKKELAQLGTKGRINALTGRMITTRPVESRNIALRQKPTGIPISRFSPKNIQISDMLAFKKENSDHTKGHQKNQHNLLCCVFALSWRMQKNPERYEKFKQSPFFEDFYRPPGEDEITKWVAYDQMDAVDPDVRDRACRYADIAKRWLGEGLKPSQVEQRLLEEGKIGGAYALCPKKQKASGGTTKTVSLTNEEYSRREPDRELDQEGDSPQSEFKTGSLTTTTSPPKPKAPRFNPKTHLLVTTESAVLAVNRLKNGTYRILVEVTADLETSWKHIRAISIEPDQD